MTMILCNARVGGGCCDQKSGVLPKRVYRVFTWKLTLATVGNLSDTSLS